MITFTPTAFGPLIEGYRGTHELVWAMRESEHFRIQPEESVYTTTLSIQPVNVTDTAQT